VRGVDRAAWLIAIALVLQGCMSLPQMEKLPSRVPFHAVYDGRGKKYVLFTIAKDENKPKDYEIVAANSFAIDPKGARHSIRVEPHGFDIEQRYPFVRDDVYVLRSAEKPEPISLRDGTWRFVFKLRRGGAVTTETFSFRLWTFHYTPAIHGAPN
jgi:hypothetical protein